MKRYILLCTTSVLILSACNDNARKRTFSARTEAVTSIDSTSGTEEQDSTAVSQTQENNTLDITIKLTIMDADSTGGTIDITENGIHYRTISSKGIEYPVTLNLNKNYLIKCFKKGYTGKIVLFDTHIPEGREKEEFALFNMTVELHKETLETKDGPGSLVGRVRYDKASGDFDKVTK